MLFSIGKPDLQTKPSLCYIHRICFLTMLLTGEIPHSICNVSTIQILHLSYNNLSGTSPECIGHFSSTLIVLDLWKKIFHGTIIGSFVKDNQLQTLNFNFNGNGKLC
ncbi:hypothetical protein Dsin_016737 [Dipteronia sinensis]|uniref:Non-specific serine/threonine protein kinase n=1 Tax=Dipteronia sinensis TaxID=43782 RepID=A0AAE0E5S7_9ROSI|nr:hypothetical protein Dsin_016737 [Dipteronia sinensis]